MIPVIVDTSDTETLGFEIASDGVTATVVVCWMGTQTVDRYDVRDVRAASPAEVAWYVSPEHRDWLVRGAAFALAEAGLLRQGETGSGRSARDARPDEPRTERTTTMDPDAALAELRRLLGRTDLELPDYERIADLTGALDQWLSSGGFLPAAWQR